MREGGTSFAEPVLAPRGPVITPICSSSISIAAYCSNQCLVAEQAAWLAVDQQFCFHARGSNLLKRLNFQRIVYQFQRLQQTQQVHNTQNQFQAQYHNETGSIALAVQGIRCRADYVYITGMYLAACRPGV